MTPHAHIECHNDQERFLAAFFDRLWDRYRQRVPYAAKFAEIVEQAGGRFVNDHIAFRTIADDSQTGIISVSRLFESLGYIPAACYQFPDKFLSAIHFQHPNAGFPKLFISELQSWRLSDEGCQAVKRTLVTRNPGVNVRLLRRLVKVNAETATELLPLVVNHIETLPWMPPAENDVQLLHQESQYAAWVLVHGYNVNHFTALVNALDIPSMPDIDATVRVLRDVGIPLKSEIEGIPGSKLRQTATEAAVTEVTVHRQGLEGPMPWSYAYFELAERNAVIDPETGQSHRFEGFLGPQATQLFDMTKVNPS